ncbi:Nipped-B-like protein B [Durusdinium trenchii]|uniref:Nipped-B-like protein B n=1 Tax=Durusdinium trenchii TaxID=1381693 RepID=A0ABP0NDB0_9DINO
MRLPKVKNKYPAPVQVTVDDIVRSAEGGTRNVGPRALPATTCRGYKGEPPAGTEVTEAAEVPGQSEKGSEPRLVFKHRPFGPSTELLRAGVRAQLRVRPKGDWAYRRLLCIGVCKENVGTRPMAKLPQGFLRYFVDYVFSFLVRQPPLGEQTRQQKVAKYA